MVCGRPWRCRVNGASYAHARRVTYLGGGIIVELYVAGENTVLLYEFSGRPEPSVVMPSGSYPVTHRQFEERGLLHHPWVACSELTMPLTLRRWEPETGWRDQDIRLVTNRRYTRLFGNRHIILPHKAETSPVTKRFLRIVQRDPDADFFLQRGLVLLRGQRLSPARRQYGVGELSLLGVGGGECVQHPRVLSAGERNRPHRECQRVTAVADGRVGRGRQHPGRPPQRGRVVRLQLEDRSPVLQGLRRPPLLGKRIAQAGVGFRRFRVELERAPPFPDGSFGIATPAQDQPQIVVRWGIPDVRHQRLAQLNERLV